MNGPIYYSVIRKVVHRVDVQSTIEDILKFKNRDGIVVIRVKPLVPKLN